jgi:hypothetical protein
MSQLGQKCHFDAVPATSGPPNSGPRQTGPAGPVSAKTGLMRHSKKTLFDHLIRARKQRRRNGDAKRFGGLEIHD